MKVEYILLFPVLLAGVILQFTPLFTRQGIYFSATVDPAFPKSDDGRRVLRSYRLQSALWTAFAVALALLVRTPNPAAFLLVPMLVSIIGSCVSYWLKFRLVHERYGRPVPDVRYAEIAPPPSKGLNLWLCAPPFIWLAGVALYLQAHWAQIPERFPVHWGADGQPNGWASRTPQGVYGPLLLAVFMSAFCLLLALALQRMTRNTTMRQVTFTVLLLLVYPVSFAFGMVGLLPLVLFPIWLVPAVTLTFAAVIIIWSAQKIMSPAARDAVPEPASDSYWKAGLFYYNPDDPAIFVSKRVGIGYTMNFANKVSWVVLVALLLIVLLPALLLRAK